MLFTDVTFGLYLIIIFTTYWLILRNSTQLQNLLLLAASYIFYGWWDWRFLTLIIITTLTTYFSAILSRFKYGRLVTTANILLNLGLLFFFKYFNFFSENLQKIFDLIGWNLDWFTLDVLLPVGISFYTFQAIAYSVDAYKREITPCRDLLSFATFIAYFPQLVAGPIERASHLLPQINRNRQWYTPYAVTGLRMILFGLVKKLCVADLLAKYVDWLFESGQMNPAVVLLIGILFSFQIYFDFSAYCEIGRGVSRLFGIELSANFRFPYFSRNIVEFWRRWHISLMLWFRNYLYIPLGGNRRGKAHAVINSMIIFILSGLWHGAAWNFIIWGGYWAIAYAIGRNFLSLRDVKRKIIARDIPSMVATFAIVSFGFYIFRCQSISQVCEGLEYSWVYAMAFILCWTIAKILCRSMWTRRISLTLLIVAVLSGIAIINTYILIIPELWLLVPFGFVTLVEWHGRNNDFNLEYMCKSKQKRLIFYWTCIVLILLSEPTDMAFIYFQF